jgi:DNA-3-methyladenine glycosylase
MIAAAAGTTVGAAASSISQRAWFDRPATDVAPDLLGCLLVHHAPDGSVVGRIVEVEAYQGPEDLAAHSSRGRTERNGVMFGPPGHLYVYLIYGMHHCANIVCGPGRKPEAVLLRAAEIVDGIDLARSRRGPVVPDARLAAGPGNLGTAFGIDRSLNGIDLLDGPMNLIRGARPPRIERSARIGVTYAREWAGRPLRFSIADDPHRSRR